MGKVLHVGVGGMGLLVLVLGLTVSMGGCSTQPTPEIKTEAPPPRPDAIITDKDCPVYVLGELRGVRKHGDKWRNDGSDCEICNCYDGQKHCYYHYCNAGLTEGYMTPPSVLGPGEKVAADQPPAQPPTDDEDHLEEGSGAQPWPDDYYKVIQEALEHDLDLASPTSRRGKTDSEEEKNPRDNETHDHLSPPDLCGRPCKKSCPQGYKIDPVNGCRRCKCLNCQSLRHCLLKCPEGFALDQHGCKTCQCRLKNAPVALITKSLDGDDFIVEEGYAISGETYGGEGEDQVTYSEVGGHGAVYVTSRDEVYATARDNGDSADPACNTTRSGDCTDGHRVFTVGSWWERGPCVSCTCMAPGYTECNVTQCAQLPCPPHNQVKIDDSCCPVCEDHTTKAQPMMNDRVHESRSTSRVPLDRMPPTRPHDLEHDHSQMPTEVDLPQRVDDDDHNDHNDDQSPRENDGMTKSAVQATGADWPQVVVIVIPILVVFALVASLIVHFWRRYHRDKYDINSYRPEEKEKLRPVKTVDDNHQVRHV